MKNAYEKPQLFAESFELAEHVAGPCNGMENNVGGSFNVTHRNGTDCGIWDADMKLFVSKSNDCGDTESMLEFYEVDTIEQLMSEVQSKCYNAFIPSATLFAS